MYGWFGQVITESLNGFYSKQVDTTFRWSMSWFIFSEVMFFAAFFGALFYARQYSVPWLDGASNNDATAQYLWPDFEAAWPLLSVPVAEKFNEATAVMGAWGLPAINTAILLTSGWTVTLAHWALKRRDTTWLNLRLDSGIYGSTFFMLTGFHGFHVTMGAIMLTIIMIRAAKGHFTPDNHFAFEAVAWYWHFVDVVWLGLFIFVYWL